MYCPKLWYNSRIAAINRRRDLLRLLRKRTANDAADGTVFIEFMLSAIKASLTEAIITSDEMSDGLVSKDEVRTRAIQRFLEQHLFIMNADVRSICGVSAATANRILAKLTSDGELEKYREGGHWAYRPSGKYDSR